MHKFFETLMKIIFLLLGTHGQRFASVTLLANVYLLFIQCMGILYHYFNKLKTKVYLFTGKMILKLQKRKVI